MTRYLTCGLLAALCSCGPTAPTPNRPELTSSEQLVDTYLAGVRIYDGRMVQVLLAANAPNAVNPTYRVSPGRIDAHLCGIYGTVRFDCPFAPQTNASALIVTGLCRGIVKDGIERCNNTRHVWYVHVENCSVITVPSE